MPIDTRQGGFLSALPPHESERVLADARQRRFQRGDIVFHEGDTGDTLHVVAAGRFGIQTGTADGDRVMLQIVTTGEVFGELSIFAADLHRTATVMTLEAGETRSIDAQAVRELCARASQDQTARLWDVETGEQLLVFEGHQGVVMTAEFSPDGAYVVTASQDGTARVWSIDGTELQRYRAAELVVNSAEFSPDGQRILVTTAEGFNFAPAGVPIEEVTTGGARLYACDVCASFDQLVALAESRVTRELTPEERATYLGQAA